MVMKRPFKTFAIDLPENGIQIRAGSTAPNCRWVTQSANRTICGPISLANALKFCGEKFSFRSREKEFKEAMKYENGRGVYEDDLIKCFRAYGFALQVRVKHPWDAALSFLKNKKGPVVLWYERSWSPDGHVGLGVEHLVVNGDDYIGAVNTSLLLGPSMGVEYVRENIFDLVEMKAFLLRKRD